MESCGGNCVCSSRIIVVDGEEVEKPLEMLLLETESGADALRIEELQKLLREFYLANKLLAEKLQINDCRDQVKALEIFVSRLLGELSDADLLRTMILDIDPNIKKKDLQKGVIELMKKAAECNFVIEE